MFYIDIMHATVAKGTYFDQMHIRLTKHGASIIMKVCPHILMHYNEFTTQKHFIFLQFIDKHIKYHTNRGDQL